MPMQPEREQEQPAAADEEEEEEEEEEEPSCNLCGRTAADFAGGPAGLRAHIPQCKASSRCA